MTERRAIMKIATWIKIGTVAVTVVLAASVYFAWRGEQREHAQLQAELKTAQAALAEATARQQARENDLSKVLAQISQQKAAVQKPAQIVQALPEVLPLPKPLEIVEETTSGKLTNGQGVTGASDSPTVKLPAEDLRPLYDFALDCKACQAKLSAAEANLKDEQVKTGALSRERDSALQAARGGSVMKRVLRGAKWFALGAAAGAVAERMRR